jgi:hypothetical protein
MNHTGSRYPKCLSVAVLAAAFLMSSELPLLAASPQSTAAGQTDDSLPEAPQPQSAPPAAQPAPSGAAGAKAADVKGAPVAQPAGAAVAPARQRGHRSLLIKVGLLAGVGIAVGSAVALTQESPARPSGSSARR